MLSMFDNALLASPTAEPKGVDFKKPPILEEPTDDSVWFKFLETEEMVDDTFEKFCVALLTAFARLLNALNNAIVISY